MTHAFSIDLDVPDLTEDLAERLGDLGEECGTLAQVNRRVFMIFHHESPSLTDSLLYAIRSIHHKGIRIKAVNAPPKD